AALELTLRHWMRGEEERLHIHRGWHVVGKTLKEEVEVRRDGAVDSVLTDRWYEFVEELIPSQVANLFFFDGERIEKLASPDKSAELVRTGVHALLGLDLLDTLEVDLLTLERRRKMAASSEMEQERLAALENELEQLRAERTGLYDRRAELHTQLTQLRNRKTKLDATFRNLGGDLYVRR